MKAGKRLAAALLLGVALTSACSSRNDNPCLQHANACPAASASSTAPSPAPSTVKDRSIPGVGATRDDWDASHTPNAAFNNGEVYGYDPSLPSYLSSNSAVYIGVIGSDRIQGYLLVMQAVGREEALARVRQELPADATVVWDQTKDQCYRVAYVSPTLEAVMKTDMVLVQLQHLQRGGQLAFSPDTFNQADFSLAAVGTKPDFYTSIDC